MITNRKELNNYIQADFSQNSFSFRDRILRFVGGGKKYFFINLRKYEYCLNRNRRIMSFFRRIKHSSYMRKLHSQIPPNVFGPGLKLNHWYGIIVNPNSKIGKNCSIHQFCTVGSDGHNDKNCPQIGDNCIIGAGSIVIGKILIGSNVTIGANAVVVHSFCDDVVIAGVPAKIVRYLKNSL